MGYKIWRRDNNDWNLAYDTVYDTLDEANEYIGSLNAQYSDKVSFGDLEFYPYREDIRLNKHGEIIDATLQGRRQRRTPSYKRKRK